MHDAQQRSYSKLEIESLLRSRRYIQKDENGGIPLTTMSDAVANNSTLYFSIESNKPVWKDADGNINDLY